MALSIMNNISALTAKSNLTSATNAQSTSIKRLSTGLRINQASDDASGLAISEKMRTQIRGLNKANENAQNGISMLQTAEGALNETHSILQRMRELAVQASNGTLTSNDRIEVQKEVDALKDEVDGISTRTEFNTKIPPVCAIASICNTPGITGSPGKWPTKKGSFIVTFLTPIMVLSSKCITLSTNKKGGRCGNVLKISVVSIIGVAFKSTLGAELLERSFLITFLIFLANSTFTV